MPESYKRETAYKLRIGNILKANQIFEQSENPNPKLQFVELGNKKILRVNIVANANSLINCEVHITIFI